MLIPEDPPLPIERDKECLDRLLVENDGQAIYSACSTEDPAAVVNSTGESLDVVLSARVGESKGSECVCTENFLFQLISRYFTKFYFSFLPLRLTANLLRNCYTRLL